MNNTYRNSAANNRLTAGFLTAKPLYLLLLPCFFILHGVTANYDLVPVKEAVTLCLLYMVLSCSIAAIAWLFFRDLHKAALMALLIMAYHFFYGAVKDWLHHAFPQSFLSRYRFIIPFSLLLFTIAIAWLKKRKSPLTRLGRYLTLLMASLILFELGWLVTKQFSVNKSPAIPPLSQTLVACDTCQKPDIFLIIPDGYAGHRAMEALFNFDNSDFEDQLRQRGFHMAANSSSNYNATLYSVASTLNMDYVEYRPRPHLIPVIQYYKGIRDNAAMKYLDKSGYQHYNCSIFDLDGQPVNEYRFFMPTGISLITSQTFTAQLEKDLFTDLVAGKFGKALQTKYAYRDLNFNDSVIARTRHIATLRTNAPKFVYTHLMLPHYPFYFDSNGNTVPVEKLAGLNKAQKNDYVEYMKYANARILALVDDLMTASAKPPVILILSDHSFRHPFLKTDHRYDFMNLNAIYLPTRHYEAFYDGISNVNQLRALFNTCFNQQLPMLKDSTVNVLVD